MPAAASEVPEIRFDRADEERLIHGAVLAEHSGQCLDLDGVAKGCASAMRFDKLHLGRCEIGVGQCFAKKRFLRGTVRRCQPTAATVLITAVPRMTATMLSPSRSASLSRFKTSSPQPSPRANPSAAASKDLQRK